MVSQHGRHSDTWAWFGASGPPVKLRLTGTTMFRSGVAVLTYRPEVA
jgi:hypothetical protein